MSRSYTPALIVLLLGCGGAMDHKSGGDHVRGKAVEIQLNTTHDDRVSASDGDHTDWKRFTLESSTVLSIHAYWDNPSITARIRVKDQFGGNIFDLEHDTGKPEDHFRGMNLRDGEFYLEVVAERGSSVYTLELKTGAGNIDYPSDPSIRRPE